MEAEESTGSNSTGSTNSNYSIKVKRKLSSRWTRLYEALGSYDAMDKFGKLHAVGHFLEKPRRSKIELPFAERLAFTPREFAALFGRGQTWGYRQLYAGRVRVIKNAGRLMIPRTEVERLSGNLALHQGNAK